MTSNNMAIRRMNKSVVLVALGGALTIVTLIAYGYRGTSSTTRSIISFWEDSSCNWLQSDGEVKGNTSWVPHGCSSSMHWYTPEEATLCFRRIAERHGRNKSIVWFQGDSTIRGLVATFAQLFSNQRVPIRLDRKTDRWSDHTIELKDAKLLLLHKFRPVLNASFLGEVEVWRTVKPTHIVAGAFLWHGMSKYTDRMFPKCAAQVNKYAAADGMMMRAGRPDATVVWVLPDPISTAERGNDVYAFKGDPVRYNQLIQDHVRPAMLATLKHYRHILAWTSASRITQSMVDQQGDRKIFADRIHIKELPRRLQAQVLMNFYCR